MLARIRHPRPPRPASRRRWPAVAIAALACTTLVTAASDAGAACFDRKTQPYTMVVDAHLHYRPFGGPAIPFTEVNGYLAKAGVKYANVFGIGQALPVDSPCTYYLNCPGTPVLPTMNNDYVNAENYTEDKPDDVRLSMSMTFPDLANPAGIPGQIATLDGWYPRIFTWMGEANVMKQALLPNHFEPATKADIEAWAPFMKILRDRNMPITLHSDLGNADNPTQFLGLMREVLQRYPNNKILWAHMGLSRELPAIDTALHQRVLDGLLKRHPNLYLDVSWRILQDLYFSKPGVSESYAAFFDKYSTRVIPGTDFVASRDKSYAVYQEELEVNSRIYQYVNDESFRNIALGQNYFRLLGLRDTAPPVCTS
ncbi:hypothetical protein GCM10009850_042150 [Nonomuraea monospora]|uniref:Amidohydrolase-related domain-containing protein n=1 Tax=Nonomuraea monospora TaxID=568818 RepID=A0ABN3CHG0_9ACTN